MKILFTGSSPKQYSDLADSRSKITRINDVSIIINSLRKSGHEVIRKRVSPNDDISEFDFVIVGIGSLGSPNYSNMLNAIDVIFRAKKVLIFHEDWKIEGTMKSLKSSKSKINELLLKKWSSGEYFYTNADLHNADELAITFDEILAGKYPVLVPGFKWGNKQIIADILNVPLNFVNSIDLSPYVLEMIYKDVCYSNRNLIPNDRIKGYMLASLSDSRTWVKKQKFTYPVHYFGCKAINAPILNDETEVFEMMNQYQGVLCPSYPQAGSGWFRMRFVYSALNKNLMIMDKADAEALNCTFISKMEDYSDVQCQDLSNEQSQKILSYQTTIKDFDEHLNSIINKYLCANWRNDIQSNILWKESTRIYVKWNQYGFLLTWLWIMA